MLKGLSLYLQQQRVIIGTNEPNKLFLTLQNDRLRHFFGNWAEGGGNC